MVLGCSRASLAGGSFENVSQHFQVFHRAFDVPELSRLFLSVCPPSPPTSLRLHGFPQSATPDLCVKWHHKLSVCMRVVCATSTIFLIACQDYFFVTMETVCPKKIQVTLGRCTWGLSPWCNISEEMAIDKKKKFYFVFRNFLCFP